MPFLPNWEMPITLRIHTLGFVPVGPGTAGGQVPSRWVVAVRGGVRASKVNATTAASKSEPRARQEEPLTCVRLGR